ncbi:MAG: hypothetical protein IJB85_02815 [Clostridia bacterium]|nr:hypothetical protein [Clostridia bacterium]
MKRVFLACLLTMLLLFVPAMAEEEPGVVVQSSCNIVQSGDYYLVYCFAQVHNNSDQIICLDEGTYQLSSGEQLLAIDEVSQLWPYFLAPGEDGFLFDIVSFEPNEDGVVVPNVTGLHYQIKYMTIDPSYAGAQLETQAQILLDERSGEMTVVCEVANTTDVDAYDAAVVFGLYTDGGQMIYADGMNLKDMGIPAGGSVLVRFKVDDALVEQWHSYNALPAHVRTNAMFRNNED